MSAAGSLENPQVQIELNLKYIFETWKLFETRASEYLRQLVKDLDEQNRETLRAFISALNEGMNAQYVQQGNADQQSVDQQISDHQSSGTFIELTPAIDAPCVPSTPYTQESYGSDEDTNNDDLDRSDALKRAIDFLNQEEQDIFGEMLLEILTAWRDLLFRDDTKQGIVKNICTSRHCFASVSPDIVRSFITAAQQALGLHIDHFGNNSIQTFLENSPGDDWGTSLDWGNAQPLLPPRSPILTNYMTKRLDPRLAVIRDEDEIACVISDPGPRIPSP